MGAVCRGSGVRGDEDGRRIVVGAEEAPGGATYICGADLSDGGEVRVDLPPVSGHRELSQEHAAVEHRVLCPVPVRLDPCLCLPDLPFGDLLLPEFVDLSRSIAASTSSTSLPGKTCKWIWKELGSMLRLWYAAEA
jgi:hypothetical protein